MDVMDNSFWNSGVSFGHFLFCPHHSHSAASRTVSQAIRNMSFASEHRQRLKYFCVTCISSWGRQRCF